MIYMGIKLYPYAIKSVALAGGVEPIAESFFKIRQIRQLHQWLEDIKYESNANITAFVDEVEFNLYKSHFKSIFFERDYFHKIYLVKHRICSEMMTVVMAYQAFVLNRPVHMNKAFLLASIIKIIPKKYLYCWEPDDDLPF